MPMMTGNNAINATRTGNPRTMTGIISRIGIKIGRITGSKATKMIGKTTGRSATNNIGIIKG
ncbi:hypothetical protein, partial [Staphylococcus haemolyticus]|uniref:hypothetical protein n=1 Tax=Staphylococcus haemolyticus TaxID=1283 RepID=UPI001C5E639C